MSAQLRGVPLVEVTRGPLVESVHNVAACAVDAAGKIVLAIGETGVPVYLRSAAKPFISAVSVMAGVPQRFGLEPREIAVMTSSHSGEPFHIDAVRSILSKIGMTESALQCGADYPYDPIYNNCSGKHAGILALCLAIGADPATYLEPSNPAQQRILRFCARMSDVPSETLAIGVDGCGIPVYAVPLANAALSYMRYATLRDIEDEPARALRVVRDAMLQFPEHMSGTGDFDAALIRAGGGGIVCKGGAEGVHATALIDKRIGVVRKVVDGAERARPPSAVAILREIGALSEGQLMELHSFAHPPVKNRAGRVVGEIRARERVAS